MAQHVLAGDVWVFVIAMTLWIWGALWIYKDE